MYRYINPYLVTIHQLYINSHFFGFFPDTSCIIHRIFDVYLHSPPDAMLDAGAGDTSLYISYTAIQSIQRYMAIQCIGCITPPLVSSILRHILNNKFRGCPSGHRRARRHNGSTGLCCMSICFHGYLISE